VLAFAGSDPSGGAGVQADLLTAAALGCHPLTVITALTQQDTAGVAAVQVVDARWVAEQARMLLRDMAVAAFKIGMVASAENAAAIAAVLSEHPGIPLVLDPVLASGRGDPLASDEVAASLIRWLVPRTTVLTPNSLEARRLAAAPDEASAALPLARCAQRLAGLGASYVLVTGAHERTPEVINSLYDANGHVASECWERLPGSYHGSGCTLAAAIAAFLAHGRAVREAVREAQAYTWETLARAYRPGAGQAIPDRLAPMRDAVAAAPAHQ
jgi:hydroxymethylpyrimidine/phosphomethylpyrimidine kinase